VFARWLGWLGIVAAIVLAFDVVYRDISPFWVWVFIASIVMLTRRGATARTPLGASLEESAATREEAGTTAA
jgi:H+/gluconate symporter-like permease